MSWFRFYTDVLNDPKVQRLSAETFRAWVNLLCLAKEHDGVLPDLPDVAFALRVSEEQAHAWLAELERRGLIDVADDGARAPHNWEGRQYASDSSTDRVRRHRAKKAAESETSSLDNAGTLLERSGNGTEQSRADTEQSRAEGADAPLLRAFRLEFDRDATAQESAQIAALSPMPDVQQFRAALAGAHRNNARAIVPWVARRLADAPRNGTGPPLTPHLVTVEEHLAAGPRRRQPVTAPEDAQHG